MIQRSVKPLKPIRRSSNPKSNKLKVPSFNVVCLATPCPHHLIKGLRYVIHPDQKDDQGVATFHYFEQHGTLDLIGYFPLNCFDLRPVKEWVAKVKGESHGRIARSAQIC